MRATHLTTLLSLTALSSVSALPNPRCDDRVLRLSVDALNVTQTKQLSKRQNVLATSNILMGTLYVVSFSIGTPLQAVTITLDTGSSDTWVDPTCSKAPTQLSIDLCNSEPRYTPGASTTAKDTGLSMSLSYGIGSAIGEYWTDDFVIRGATIHSQRLGVASSTNELAFGIFGVGPGIELTGYPTIIDQLAMQGITNSRAFSLDLRGVDSPDGAIIFGGIDTMKYIGPLEKRPIIPAAQAPDAFDRYWIYMTSVGITKPGATPKLYPPTSTNPNGQAVFLDSGTTLSGLPTPLFNAIAADFPGATFDAGSGMYTVDCAVANQPGTVDFGFGNTVIHVPYHEFIWFVPGAIPSCRLGIMAEDKTPVLGDSFLRAAYVVYDQDNKNLLLANAANCGTNLVAIGKGPDAVPSITGACSISSTASSSSSSTTFSSSTTSSSSNTIKTSSTISASSSSSTTTLSNVYSNTSITTGPTTTASTFTLSTVYSTATYTITSCPPTVTNCPLGHLTTEVISLYTTYCPIGALTPASLSTMSPMPTSVPSITSTVYATTTYTITSCAPTVPNCPYGSTTTSTYALYTTICPLSSAAAPPTSSPPTPLPTHSPVVLVSSAGQVPPPTPSGTAKLVVSQSSSAIAAAAAASSNTAVKASGTGVSPQQAQFTGGAAAAVAVSVEFVAVVMAAVVAVMVF